MYFPYLPPLGDIIPRAVVQPLVDATDAIARWERDPSNFVGALNAQLNGFEKRVLPDAVYQELFGPGPDPRTAGWALVPPAMPILIVSLYLLVIIGGRAFVKAYKPQPLSLRGPMFIYNGAMTLLSAWMAYEAFGAAAENFGWTQGRGTLWVHPIDNFETRADGYWSPSGYRLAMYVAQHTWHAPQG